MMFNSGRKCKVCKGDIDLHRDAALVKVNWPREIRGYYHPKCLGPDVQASLQASLDALVAQKAQKQKRRPSKSSLTKT